MESASTFSLQSVATNPNIDQKRLLRKSRP
jgi:hypothetical protein